jgi:hypothetical protein
MRGENRQGRFSIPYEHQSIISGTSTELVHTVGTSVQWWIYDQGNSVIDPIYDVGSSSGTGRLWKTPLTIPVVNAHLEQGVTVQNDRGFYNTDQLTIIINVDVIEDRLNFYGANANNIPELGNVEVNPDAYLRDRIVFRDEVFTPVRVLPEGIIQNNYTLLRIQCNQVNPEELVNDSQFSHYASYNPFGETGYGQGAYGAGLYGN